MPGRDGRRSGAADARHRRTGDGAEEGVGAAAALGGVGGLVHGLAEGLGGLGAELVGPGLVLESAEGVDLLDLGLDVGLGEPVGEGEEGDVVGRGGGDEALGGVEEGGEEEGAEGGKGHISKVPNGQIGRGVLSLES